MFICSRPLNLHFLQILRPKKQMLLKALRIRFLDYFRVPYPQFVSLTRMFTVCSRTCLSCREQKRRLHTCLDFGSLTKAL